VGRAHVVLSATGRFLVCEAVLLDLSQVDAIAPERQNAIADLSRQVEQTRRVAESIWTFRGAARTTNTGKPG
jgi:hypothetical protein